MSAFAQFPSVATTGITATHCPNWAAIKTNTSGRTISTNGAVIQNQEITGQMVVNASNVTFDCVKINANGAQYGITCLTTNCGGLLVEDSEIYNTTSTGFILKGRPGSIATARRIHVHTSVRDTMKIRGDALLIDSYVHVEPTPGSHNDAIQIESGSNIDIRNNTIHGPLNEQTSAILAKSDFGIINNLRIYGNQFSGGTHTVYSVNGGFGQPTNVIVANNQWVSDSWKFSPASFETNASHCLEWYGNTFSAGGSFAVPTSASPQGSCAVGVFPPISGVTQAAPATFTPAPASFPSPVSVTISTTETGGTIHYTVDGSVPDGTDPVYSTPIVISSTTTLRAIVIKSGVLNSAITTGTYTITGACTY